MTPTQRTAALRLADELQRFDGPERESLRDEAAALLRELAPEHRMTEPVQEPVGWWNEIDGEFEHSYKKPWMVNSTVEWLPLYAAPQQRKPLSDAQIEDCIDTANRQFNGRRLGPGVPQQMTTYDDWKYWLARAIERMHDIKETP